MVAQLAVDGFDHIALGAASIGHHRSRLKMRRHVAHHRAHLPDRGGQQHEVRPLERIGPALRGLVDHAKRHGLIERTRTPAHTHDTAHHACTTQGKRKRASDQAHATNHQFPDYSHSSQFLPLGP